ncbi:MAG: hypothetical protein EOP04_04205 [Proteobacteria bacterium]|nr:MAG: hypothetical protein EOP04_04205 [Pseudomonadota bacterium]
MEFNTDLLQSLIVGATGGIPTTVLLVQIVKGIATSLKELKDKLEVFSSRLQRLELAFDVLFQSEMKRVSESQTKLEARLQNLETALNRLQP